eukprot:Pgem_evm1s11586
MLFTTSLRPLANCKSFLKYNTNKNVPVAAYFSNLVSPVPHCIRKAKCNEMNFIFNVDKNRGNAFKYINSNNFLRNKMLIREYNSSA